MRIRLAVHEIYADEAFTATDGLISQSFVVTYVHPTYVRIALIWGFPAQLSLWKSVYWLWRYKLNEVCDTKSKFHSKNIPNKSKKLTESGKPSYAQILSNNINNILKIKKNFPELSNKKIEEINKTIFSKKDKPHPIINITTKDSSRK